MSKELSQAFGVMRNRHGIDTRAMAKSIGCSIRNVQEQMSPTAAFKFVTIEMLCAEIGCTVNDLVDEWKIIKGIK